MCVSKYPAKNHTHYEAFYYICAKKNNNSLTRPYSTTTMYATTWLCTNDLSAIHISLFAWSEFQSENPFANACHIFTWDFVLNRFILTYLREKQPAHICGKLYAHLLFAADNIFLRKHTHILTIMQHREIGHARGAPCALTFNLIRVLAAHEEVKSHQASTTNNLHPSSLPSTTRKNKLRRFIASPFPNSL